MGIRLVVEVLDHAPADLTPAERLVLVVIAEQANDDTRLGYAKKLSVELISKRTGIKPKSLSELFRRLARRQPPLEVRVAVGIGKDGRPVFAHEGTRTTFCVPVLRPHSDGPSEPRDPTTVGAQDEEPPPPWGLSQQRPHGGGGRDHHRGASQAQSPHAGGALSLRDPSPSLKSVVPQGQKAPRQDRGHRIPEDFAVNASMRAWHAESTPSIDLTAETLRFQDYWRAKAGATALKADWTAAWRSWMRNAVTYQAERNTSRTAGTNRHIDQQSPEQRASRNPFAGAIRASQHTNEETR